MSGNVIREFKMERRLFRVSFRLWWVPAGLLAIGLWAIQNTPKVWAVPGNETWASSNVYEANVIPEEQIPDNVGSGWPGTGEPYKTWSLFLICNPDWLRAQNRDKLVDLNLEYKIFGSVIGPRHLSVWFWKQHGGSNIIDNTDVSRSAAYCEKLRLVPSGGPYVLVTTTYPDLQANLEHYYVMRLGGLDAYATTLLLDELTDQILVDRLNQEELDTDSYWQKWGTVFRSAVDRLSGVAKWLCESLDEVKITIYGGLVITEIVASPSC